MAFIGSLDQGTSSTRFIVFDEKGSIVGQHQLEHRQILPQAGWVEHDASEIWQRTQEVIKGALANAGILANQLAGIGITNQRETTVIWDKESGRPLSNAIVWQDTRTQEFLSSLSEEVKSKITYKTGLAIAPYFSGSKMNWLLKDVTNASRTLLMDLETLDWDDELLKIFAVPRSILPRIASSSEIYGKTLASGPLGAEVPIAGILGDQQAAMVGQACFERGESKTTYGTGNFALLNTGEEIVRSKNGLLTTVCFKFGAEKARYALEGSVAVTGSAIQWLRDQLGIIKSAPDVEELAKSVTDNGGVYFVPAFSGLFAPYWRNDARGVVVGLTRAATKAHLSRAALEAICYQTRDVLDAMSADSGVKLPEMRVDGGITANELCMQMQADIMQVDVVRPKVIETTALGAAYAAGLATGFFSDKEQLRRNWQEGRRWKPNRDSVLSTVGLANWKRAIDRTLDWIK
ncbi:MAG: glycerol kinase [Actinobacteria bacterium]|nr:glycerol kinase [Actinomycetota bacterium]